MVEPAPHGLRILISAASFADASAALRLVAQLPTAFHTALGGVLVEDPDTFAACQIPGRRIVLPSGMTALAPDAAQLRTLLQADARAFQHLLSQTAGRDGPGCFFARHQGELVTSAMSAAQGWDVLVIGFRPLNRVRGKIVRLQGPQGSSTSLQSAAHSLAQRFHADQVVFSVGQRTDTKPGTMPFDNLDDALRAMAQVNALAVLVDMDNGPILGQADLARLLGAARCPLIVFGAARPQGALAHSIHMPPAPQTGARK